MPKNASSSSAGPTLAVVNARIWTGDPRRPWADALAVGGDRFTAAGSSEENRFTAAGSSAEIRKAITGATRVIDAAGMMVVPGFIDAHVHFIPGGFGLASVQLREAKTREEFVRRIAQHAASLSPGEWITRGDWDHELWGGELPRRDWIDAMSPHNPVWVNRLDGHMALANTAALRAAGVDSTTGDVDGGTIARDDRGEPTGIFKDNAQRLIARAVPAPTPEQEDRALDAAMRFVAGKGVTSVHNMGSWRDLEIFDRAYARGNLRTRIYAAVPLDTWAQLREVVSRRGRGDAWLRIGALKGFVDGSLGSHTAAMLEPYTDAPADRGLFVNALDDLRAWTVGADAAGLHVIIHAIGDHAVRVLLDIYEEVERELGSRDRRFRVEHAQHVAASDVPRFGRLRVIASMQPYHAIDDGRWAERLIGPQRAAEAFPIRSLLDAGADVAFGSDWFVAPPTPLDGIYAAVTRRTLDGARPGGWHPEQRINVDEALRAYTSDAAFASFEEHEKGTIGRGMLADFVVLDRDITQGPVETIPDTRVMMTVVGGRVVHDAGGLKQL
jgi:predicted amidohydrolase YtcJ